MADRPAAELLAELLRVHTSSTAAELLAGLPDFYDDDNKLSLQERQYRDVLIRLARAEQALAEAKADAWDEGVGWVVDMYDASAYLANNPYRAPIRASQGGQT